MSQELLLATFGTVGTLCLGVIAFFIKKTMTSIETQIALAVTENGELKQRVYLLEQKSASDLKHLAEMTNQKLDNVTLEINHLNGNVKQYMNNMNHLIKATEDNTYAIENLIKVSEKHEKKFEQFDEQLMEFYKNSKK